MLIISVVLLALLAVATPETYVLDAVPVAFLPAYNSPYRGREIKLITDNQNSNLNKNPNAPNVPSREVPYGCMPYQYDLPGSHSGFYGCRKTGDKLLFTQDVFKPRRFLSAREKFIEFPGDLPKGHVRNEVITAIWCYDLRGYGKGGYCSIMEGGIGMKYVRVHIYHTERNIPLRYKIEIYGNTTTVRK